MQSILRGQIWPIDDIVYRDVIRGVERALQTTLAKKADSDMVRQEVDEWLDRVVEQSPPSPQRATSSIQPTDRPPDAQTRGKDPQPQTSC